MKYQYNFGFLAQWTALNKDIAKGYIQDAIGSKSNNGFKAWERGDGPMPIITMLRFCNTFHIPLTAFIRDAEADERMVGAPPLPKPTDTLEPSGGYETSANNRMRGERSILNPLDVDDIPSVLPEGEILYAPEYVGDVQHVAHANMAVQKAETVVGNISDANMKAIIEIESKHQEQVNRLLNIIADQQKQIADLTNQVMAAQKDDGDNGKYGYNVVSEMLPSRK